MASGTTCSLGLKYSDNLSLTGVINTQISGKARVRYTDDRRSADLLLERAHITGLSRSDQTQVMLTGGWKAPDGLSLSGDFRFFRRRTENGSRKDDEYFNYRFNASKNFKHVSLRAVAEQYVKPVERREKEEEGEVDPLPYEAIGRAPEIVLEGHPLKLGAFPLRLRWNVAFGRYAERTSLWFGDPIIRGSKVHIGIDGVEEVYRLGNTTKATLSAGCGFDSYTTGDSRYVLQGALALETRGLDNAVIISGRYDYCGVFGETPFAFDKKDRKGLMTGRLTLSKGIFTASMDCGYDFYTKIYRTVTGKARLSQGKAWAVEASAAYDPQSGRCGMQLGSWRLLHQTMSCQNRGKIQLCQRLWIGWKATWRSGHLTPGGWSGHWYTEAPQSLRPRAFSEEMWQSPEICIAVNSDFPTVTLRSRYGSNTESRHSLMIP